MITQPVFSHILCIDVLISYFALGFSDMDGGIIGKLSRRQAGNDGVFIYSGMWCTVPFTFIIRFHRIEIRQNYMAQVPTELLY